MYLRKLYYVTLSGSRTPNKTSFLLQVCADFRSDTQDQYRLMKECRM
ncbi:hypothetical protein JHW43_000724 [Diplocarpon mali]|nr:hypothetical protein JHW43_000724 [Diplocarpon mali]